MQQSAVCNECREKGRETIILLLLILFLEVELVSTALTFLLFVFSISTKISHIEIATVPLMTATSPSVPFLTD